jgi:zinc protease
MPGNYETVGSLLNGVSNIVKYNRPLDYLDNLAEKRSSVSIDDVISASTKYINPDKWTWIIVGDLSKVQAGIEGLELGEIQVINAE